MKALMRRLLLAILVFKISTITSFTAEGLLLARFSMSFVAMIAHALALEPMNPRHIFLSLQH